MSVKTNLDSIWDRRHVPRVFVVGAPKCGTTAFCGMLEQHPEVFVPRLQEPGFFSVDLDRGIRRLSAAEYFDLFQDRNARYCVDGSTNYLYSRAAPELIAAARPDARIFVLIRDPVKACYSLYRYRRFIGQESETDFARCLDREESYLSGVRNWGVPLELKNLYTELALFAGGIERYRRVFGTNRVMVIRHDELRADHATVVRKAFRFLEIDEGVEVANRQLNVTGTKRSEWFGELIAKRPGWVNSLGYRLPKVVRSNAYALAARLNTSYAPPPPLSKNLEARLREQFRSDIRRTADLVGSDLSHWL